jgi:acetyl-CoA/propionyl-CoA carboxylase biotin carboxyl carrier protein
VSPQWSVTPASRQHRGNLVYQQQILRFRGERFLPSGGRILALREPCEFTGVRVDSGISEGSLVGSDYDPMLAKIIAHGADRAEALRRLDAALANTVLLGVEHNIGFLRALLADADVRAGNLDTGLVERRGDTLTARELPADVMGVAVGVTLLDLEPHDAGSADPFDLPGGWRLGDRAWTSRRLIVADTAVEVRYRGRAGDAELTIDGGAPIRTATTSAGQHTQDAVTRTYAIARDPSGAVWIGRDGQSWAVRQPDALEAAAASLSGVDGPVLSPMPGTVTVVAVEAGQAVSAGQRLVVVEAMKMEHVIVAPVDGTVAAVRVRVGDTVAKDAVLATIDGS